MSKVTTVTPNGGRRVFMLSLLVFLAAWAAAFIFLSRVFGVAASLELSTIILLPVLFAGRMLRRWPSVQGRELTLLLTLAIVATGVSAGIVWDWYDTGMDRYHAEEVEYLEFAHALREDPAFRNVEVYVSPKHIFWLRGAVDTNADLARLRALADECRIVRWNEKLIVSGTE